jgi:DNA-binding MarR family transcriptional regulator
VIDCVGEVEERIDDNVCGARSSRLKPLRPRGSDICMVTITMYSSGMSSPAHSPPPSTGYLLWHLSLRWRVALDRALAPLGLTSSQYGVLASLHGFSQAGSRPSQRELASFSGLEPMHVSKLIRALERTGLVERAGNPDDTRAVQLNVTARGVEVVTAAREKVIKLEDRRLAPLGGRRSKRSVELRDTLLTLLRHAEAMNTERDGKPAAR